MVEVHAGVAGGYTPTTKKKKETAFSSVGMPSNIAAIVNSSSYAPKPSASPAVAGATRASSGGVSAPNISIPTFSMPTKSEFSFGAKPTYTSRYQNTIDSLLDKITNREKFSYDFNADPLFQQYKDQYTKLGTEASMQATADAATMSGGYGNSYGATAASQANQQYLTQLNNVIPQLYEAAMNKYNTELSQMFSEAGLYMDAENMDYGKYRDSVSDYYQDYGNAYQKYRDDYSDSVSAAQIAYDQSVQQAQLQMQQQQLASTIALNNARAAAASTGTSSSSSKKSSGASTKVGEVLKSTEGLTDGTRNSIRSDMSSLKTEDERRRYIANLYNQGKISEANLYYFQDMYNL